MTYSAQQLVRAAKNQHKAFGSTNRDEGTAQLREAKRQAKALASLLGAAA